jgi:hypothetical protein
MPLYLLLIINFYFIQGRAALVSGPKRQSITNNIPTSNRSITTSTTTSSSPSFSNIENIRRYSLSRTLSEQPTDSVSGTSTPSTSRRTSTSETINEGSRRGLRSFYKNIYFYQRFRFFSLQTL